MLINSKVILVMGGACGIGAITTAALVSQNYRVICADINNKKLEEIKKKYADKYENLLFTHYLDMTDRDSVSQLLIWAKNQFRASIRVHPDKVQQTVFPTMSFNLRTQDHQVGPPPDSPSSVYHPTTKKPGIILRPRCLTMLS